MCRLGCPDTGRDLYPLEPFEKEDAEEVIDLIEKYQRECFEKYGIHFIHGER